MRYEEGCVTNTLQNLQAPQEWGNLELTKDAPPNMPQEQAGGTHEVFLTSLQGEDVVR